MSTSCVECEALRHLCDFSQLAMIPLPSVVIGLLLSRWQHSCQFITAITTPALDNASESARASTNMRKTQKEAVGTVSGASHQWHTRGTRCSKKISLSRSHSLSTTPQRQPRFQPDTGTSTRSGRCGWSVCLPVRLARRKWISAAGQMNRWSDLRSVGGCWCHTARSTASLSLHIAAAIQARKWRLQPSALQYASTSTQRHAHQHKAGRRILTAAAVRWASRGGLSLPAAAHSTVTDLAKLRGWSTLHLRMSAMK